VLAHEARHQRHGDVVADGQRRADSQEPDVAVGGEGVLELLRLLGQRLGSRAQRAAEVAQLQALADPVEQLDIELALQVGERSADRRLRHRQLLRRPADALATGHGQEDLELS
jgi:hypothetical protein